MKKVLTLGAASLAVAAMPVVGVFAADTTTQTDTLSVTIDQACTISSATHTDGSGTWSSTSGDATLSATMIAGNYNTAFGQTSLNIFCNDTDGWTVSVVTPDLASGSDTIPFSGTAITGATTSGYSLTASGTGANGVLAKSGDTIATNSSETKNAGDTFTVTYGIAVADGQAAGTYTGNVVYTLTNL